MQWLFNSCQFVNRNQLVVVEPGLLIALASEAAKYGYVSKQPPVQMVMSGTAVVKNI